jgi:chromosome segregation protein
MHGFKSFVDKTVMELTPGVSVIVGPNGCGKSNITDAIRWVLGEQVARHLRGTRMDDVIFSGTASRKPLSFAEVSVTMDHSDRMLGLDYQEVTITRRIYRNGESEYLLNRSLCRLKDILELFMDTGIGKEAYSFMGQGRVDQILNAHPEERRQIFEEAAGILKYKSRKREAQRRLAETAENLLRVGDIIHELSAQLPPLEEQSEKARHFLAVRGQLKSLEVDLLVHDGKMLQSRWYELDERFQTSDGELLEQQAAITRKEAELGAIQLTLNKEQAVFLQLQQENQHLSSELETINSRIAVTAEKERGFERQSQDALTMMEELGKQRDAIRCEVESKEMLLSQLSDKLARAAGELHSVEQELGAVEDSAEVRQTAQHQDELEKLLPEVRRIQMHYDRLEIEAEQQTAQRIKVDADREKRNHEITVLEEKKTQSLQELKKSKEDLYEIDSEQQRLRSEHDVWIVRLASIVTERERLEKNSAPVMDRLRLLREMDDTMAGYFQGVRTVLSAKQKNENNFAGIYGTVADLIKVPAAYVAALEAVLGASLQHLVVEDDSVAKAAISYLKKNRGGRATFLPLNQIERRAGSGAAADGLDQIPGYIGLAGDLVEVPVHYKIAVDSLLFGVHLVQDLDTAVRVARKLKFRARVVTLDGDVIQRGGAMTGGRDKKQTGVLSRRKEINALQQNLQQKLEQTGGLKTQEKEISAEISVFRMKLAELDEKKHQLELVCSLKEQEASMLGKQLLSMSNAMDVMDNEAATLSQGFEALSRERQKAEKELKLYREKEQRLRLELARLQGMASAREQEKRSLRESCTECKVRLASLAKQREHYEEELERLDGELRTIKGKQSDKEKEIYQLRSTCLELNSDIEEKKEEAAELERSRTLLQAKLFAKEKAIKEKGTEYREEMERVRQLEKALSALERRQVRLETDKDKVKMELKAVLDRLLESWQLEFVEAEGMARPLEDRDTAILHITGLKEQLTALGTVNLGAIEEYSRISERVEFLTAQRDDLRNGEKDLQRIIREIDNRMGEKFNESFSVINESFGQVFKDLFGGGRAFLRLTEPQSPLESGIEIVAQPPGKKLQLLSLLSGGEKALTAIALLFSFLKVKPTPFCILDEIETSLDEANLSKFSQYLRGLSAEIQFILISHRKKTMEQANVLYGVTMEESGISKLISVRLRDGQEPSEATA